MSVETLTISHVDSYNDCFSLNRQPYDSFLVQAHHTSECVVTIHHDCDYAPSRVEVQFYKDRVLALSELKLTLIVAEAIEDHFLEFDCETYAEAFEEDLEIEIEA